MSAPIKQSHREILVAIIAPEPAMAHRIVAGEGDDIPDVARALAEIARFEERVCAEAVAA